MRIVLLGAPGSGKGTQAELICNQYQIPRISTGDILREATTKNDALSNKIREVIESGQLVSDDIVIRLVEQRIVAHDCKQGFLFDGFPRTLKQASALDRILQQLTLRLDSVLELVVDNKEILRRLTGRRIHLASGRSYHVEFKPPKTPNVDDVTGEPLIQRNDDREETIKKRLLVYNRQTTEVINYYHKQTTLHTQRINGMGDIAIVRTQIDDALSATNNK